MCVMGVCGIEYVSWVCVELEAYYMYVCVFPSV